MVKQNQIIEQKITKDRREGKGRVLALSRRIYRLLQQNTQSSVTDVYYYVESEISDDHYYCVKYNPSSSVVESWFCSCKDNSTRHMKCKHLFAIEFAIKWGTIQDIDKVPSLLLEANKRFPAVVQQSNNNKKSSYLEDDYDF
jgi:predicted nucleic acid-binding Zn finger protein